MPASVNSELVWREIERNMFAVLGMVTSRGEARTAGIVYTAFGHEIFIGSRRDAWKVRHIAQNPNVSLTVTLAKRVPFMPWIKIPAATITLQGTAEVEPYENAPPEVVRRLTHGVEFDPETLRNMCLIRVTPRGRFITYGVGVGLLTMRHPEAARGTAPV